jgi:hypothetical protein
MEGIINELLARTLNQLSSNANLGLAEEPAATRPARREDVTNDEDTDLRAFLQPSETFENNRELLQLIHSIETDRHVYDTRRRHMRVLSDAMEDYQNNMQLFFRTLSTISTTRTETRTFHPRPRATPPMGARVPSRGLSDRQVELATQTFVYNPSENNEPRCPISLEDFTAGEEIVQIIGCSHYFKCNALREWFRRNTQCPVCRYNVTNSSGRVRNMPAAAATAGPPFTPILTTSTSDAWTTILAGLITTPNNTQVYTVESLTLDNAEEVD